jgi:hypothetical protein
MNYEIIDNFLQKEDFENIKNLIFNPNFSWNLAPVVTTDQENLPTTSSYYFTHMLWSGFYIDPQVQSFAPLLNGMDCKSVMRIKANLYPSTENISHHQNHIDYNFSHRGAIFYLNTNNGLTVVENEKVESIENRLLLFDPSKPHHSTTCTDEKCRININFNFF